MPIILRRIVASVGLAFVMTLGSVGVVQAQEKLQQPRGGITVTPAKLTMQLPKDGSPQEVAVGIRNNGPKATRLGATIRGLQLTNDGSLGPSDTLDAGLTQALSVDMPDFVLEPTKSINLKVRLRDSIELTPGGHYASLFIRELQTPGQNLTLSQAVSIQIFLVKEAGAVRAVSLEGLSDNGGLLHVPNSIIATFSNAGNVGIVPRASVAVYDPRGRLVASGVLNVETVMVFPGKQTRLQTLLTPIGRAWIPGTYRVQVTYRYEGSDDHLVGSTKLLIVPPLFLAGVTVGLLLVGLLGWLAWYFWPSRKRRGAFRLKPPKTSSAAGSGSAVQTSAGAKARRRPRRVIDIK